MERVISVDKSMIGSDSQPTASPSRSSAHSRVWCWLSVGLIVMGGLLLGAGGVIALLNSAAVIAPPPPVGVVEPIPPSGLEGDTLSPSSADLKLLAGEVAPESLPGLDQNPLPFFAEETVPGTGLDYSAPVLAPLPDLVASSVLPDPEGAGVEPKAQDVPGGPSPAAAPNEATAAENPPTRILAPDIDLDSEVVPVGWKPIVQGGKVVSVWDVAEYAAGWHQNSALPGAGGNVVLSGHHNTKGEVFRYLVDLDPGDTITLYVADQPYTYTVESRFVVRDKGASAEKRRENARWIGPFPEERLTLVTCWPYTSNTHRMIVVAKPTD